MGINGCLLQISTCKDQGHPAGMWQDLDSTPGPITFPGPLPLGGGPLGYVLLYFVFLPARVRCRRPGNEVVKPEL